MNNGQGGLSFDSGGLISLHDVLNTNGYRVVGENGGVFEVDDNGKVKMHEDLDLNGHGIDEVLSFRSDNIVLQKDLDLNNKVVINGGVHLLKYEDGSIKCLSPLDAPYFKTREFIRGSINTTEEAFVFGSAQYFQIPYSHLIEGIHFFYVDKSLASYQQIGVKLNYEPNTATSSSQIVTKNIYSPPPRKKSICCNDIAGNSPSKFIVPFTYQCCNT